MYSRHSRGFLASSELSRMLLERGLQLPHFVFIRCTKNFSTFTPMSRSHFATNGGIDSLSCSRYHASRTDCFFSSLDPERMFRRSVLCLSSTPDAARVSITFKRYRLPQT